MPKNFYAADFTMEHYKYLLSKLMATVNEEFFDDKKGAIKKGMIEFFARSHQDIDLEVSLNNFSIKKHLIYPTRPESYDRMLHRNGSILIDVFKRKSEFMPLPFLVSIPEQIRTQVLQGFIDSNDPLEIARQTTRQQINAVFSLEERDIIFFLRGRISIRYYTPPKKIPPGTDKRFAGESVELMEAMYAKYFPHGAWDSIEPVLGELINDKLNFSVIDNLTFTKTFIPVFRSMIEIILLDIVDVQERDKIEGFTGYVLRQYFHDILIFTARNLLEYVELRDKNAEAFIKYFSDEVIVDASGNRVQKYAIIDTRQQRWNFSSIISMLMQYKQAKIKLTAAKEAIIAAQARFNESQNDINVEVAAKRKIIDKIAEIELLISENDTKIMQQQSKTATKTEEALSLKSTISRLNKRHQDLLDKKKIENNQLEIANGKIANKNIELSRRQKKLAHEKKALKTIQEQTDPIIETYELIVEAIATVLPKR